VTETVRIERGRYHDSVTLMRASAAARDIPGVVAVIAAMGTELNRSLVIQAGFADPDATADDLVVAVSADGPATAEAAVAAIDRQLAERRVSAGGGDRGQTAPRTVETAAARAPDAGVVVVSVPGPHAYVEAMAALGTGRHVMVFSDGVDVAAEVALKREATALGRLVMGPDCGTAILDGVGLGFANVVVPGPVALVAASGTGAQQLCCLLDGAGIGVRHVIGVGGRDLSSDVGGVSTLAALPALDDDPAVRVIGMVSKPPDPGVAPRSREQAPRSPPSWGRRSPSRSGGGPREDRARPAPDRCSGCSAGGPTPRRRWSSWRSASARCARTCTPTRRDGSGRSIPPAAPTSCSTSATTS
jgi:FdrA protein